MCLTTSSEGSQNVINTETNPAASVPIYGEVSPYLSVTVNMISVFYLFQMIIIFLVYTLYVDRLWRCKRIYIGFTQCLWRRTKCLSVSR